jgi:hypothetical protein
LRQFRATFQRSSLAGRDLDRIDIWALEEARGYRSEPDGFQAASVEGGAQQC